MLKYTLQRLLAAVITFFITLTILFFIIRSMPNNLLEQLVDFGPSPGGGFTRSQVTQYTVDRIMERFKWDRPLPVQFYYMVVNYLRLDFGISLVIRPDVPVYDVMMQALPVTVQLNVFVLIFTIPMGLFVGISTALRKNRPYDHIISSLSIFFISAPMFIMATLLQYFFAYRMGWGDVILAAETQLNWTRFRSMILPILALSFFPIANIGRLLRAELSEALTSDFMLLARAKGQTYSQAIIRHALRISCVPLLGVFLAQFIFILSGSLVVEEIFSIPGIARIMVRSINAHDYQLLLAILYFYTVISLLFGIVVDIGLGIIDPRIRMGGKKDE
jgi:oligopeptide transport system permease protein